jgi:methionyl-tRNA formyltransferase
MKILVFISNTTGHMCLQHLLSDHMEDDYLFIVSDPDKNLIIDTLKKNNLNYLELSKDNINLLKNESTKYDWLLNLWGGYIFKDDVLSLANNSLNIHPSFLPFGRGRDPVVWAIYNEHPAGVSLHKITKGVDEGPIFFQEEVRYEFPTKGAELYRIVEERCWQTFHEKWSMIKNGKMKPFEQNSPKENTTSFRKDLIDNKTVFLEDDLSSNKLINKILAYDFHEEFSLNVNKNNKNYSIKLIIEESDE